jgi:hypothetical protein
MKGGLEQVEFGGGRGRSEAGADEADESCSEEDWVGVRGSRGELDGRVKVGVIEGEEDLVGRFACDPTKQRT